MEKPEDGLTKFTNYDSLRIRRLKIAQIYGIDEEFVKILEKPIKDAYKYMGVYMLPLTPETVNQFGLDEDELGFYKAYWNKKGTMSGYKNKLETLKKILKNQEEILEDFAQVVANLDKLKSKKISSRMDYSHRSFFIPKFKFPGVKDNIDVDPEDWIEIIDRAKLSKDVPLIYGIIPDTASKFSVRGFTFFYENRDSLGLVWDQLIDLNIITNIYKVVDLKNPYLEKIRKKIEKNMELSKTMVKKHQIFIFVIADGIQTCVYDLLESKLYFEAPEDGTDIEEILRNTFPMLSLENSIKSGFRRTFKMQDIELNNMVILDMIRTDDLFRKFLFLDESKKAFPDMEKPYFTFHGYEDPYEIKINMNIVKDERRTIEIIINVDNEEQAQNFELIFSKLMTYYMKNYENTLKLYTELLVKVPQNFKQQPMRFRKPIKSINKIVKYLPENRRPVILDNESSEKITASFPPKGNPEFYYVCEDPIYSYPSTVEIDGKLIPFCKKITELTEKEIEKFGLEEKISEYNEEKGTKNILSGEGEIPLNRLAYLSSTELSKFLNVILKDISPDSKLGKLGNVSGFDSLIGCISVAIDDPKIKVANPISYLRNIRRKMAKGVNPAVCAQELPGISLSEIGKMLEDPYVDLDSKKFFRAVEQYFKINLFIWYTNENGELRFEIPNGKFYHARRFDPALPCILIYRFEPQKKNYDKETQYQLIIKYGSKSNTTIRIFPPKITQKLIELYYSFYKVSVWETGKVISNGFAKELLSGGKKSGQILDFAGKCRGLIVDNICILTPPTAPYDLEVIDPKANNVDKLPNLQWSAASRIDGKIIGVWYDILYFPINAISDITLETLPDKKPPWIPESKIGNFDVNYKVIRTLMTIVRWLYLTDSKRFEKRILYDPTVRYQIVDMGRKLPKFKLITEAIEFIKEKFIGIVRDQNIILPGDYIFKYMKKTLERASEEWTKIPGFIPNFYLYRSDFHTPEDLIFLSLNTLDMALEGNPSPGVQPRAKLPITEPSIIREGNQLYLFSPYEGDAKHATYELFVKIRGLQESYDKLENSYVLYTLDSEGHLIPIKGEVKGDNFLTLIDGGILVPLL